MRLVFNLILFFLLNSTSTAAQLLIQPRDSLRIFYMLTLADKKMNENGGLDSAFNICQKAYLEAKQLKYEKGEAFTLVKLSQISFDKSALEKSNAYNGLALSIATRLSDKELFAAVYNNIGNNLSYTGRQKEAIDYFEKALTIHFEKEQSRNTASVYNSMGNAYMEMGELDRQMEWQTKALILYEKLNDKKGTALVMDNIAGLYLELGKNKEAIWNASYASTIREELGFYADMALSYNNLSQIYLYSDSLQPALYYGELGLQFAILSKYKDRLAHAYTTQTVLKNRQQKNVEALAFEKKAIDILETSGNDIMLSRRYISAAILSKSKEVNDSAGALVYYQKAIGLATKINAKMNLRDAYFSRSGFYTTQNEFKNALEDYKKYTIYRDSIINEETKSKVRDIEKKYETEKKDNEINRLITIQKIKQLEIEKQKAIISGNKALELKNQNEIELLSQAQELRDIKIKQQEEQLVKQSLLATTNLQKIQLAEKENFLKKKQLKNQKIIRNLFVAGFILLLLLGITYLNRLQLKKKLEQQKNLLAIRSNISQDLHDDIGASLSSINILNELARRNIENTEKSKEYLDKASEDIQRISESLSDIVWNVNPQSDDLNNLFIRMKRYAADMLDGKNIKGEFDFPVGNSGLAVSMTKRRDLYLIFKEAVNNLAKYSQAKNAVISVRSEKNQIRLLVQDDGKGFIINSIGNGNGLKNMEQRAKASDADLSIRTAPGEGTAIELKLSLI